MNIDRLSKFITVELEKYLFRKLMLRADISPLRSNTILCLLKNASKNFQKNRRGE